MPSDTYNIKTDEFNSVLSVIQAFQVKKNGVYDMWRRF